VYKGELNFIMQLKKQFQSINCIHENGDYGFTVPFLAKLPAIANSDSMIYIVEGLNKMKENYKFEIFSDKDMTYKIEEIDKKNRGIQKLIPLKKESYFAFTPQVLNTLNAFGENDHFQLGIGLNSTGCSDIITVGKNMTIKSLASSGTVTIIQKEDNQILATGEVLENEAPVFKSNHFELLIGGELVAVGPKCVAVVKSGKVLLFLGDNASGKHFDNTSKLAPTMFYKQNTDIITSKITAISCGYDFSILLTENNEVFEVRNSYNPRFLEGGEEKDKHFITKLDVPSTMNEKAIKPMRVWCSKDASD